MKAVILFLLALGTNQSPVHQDTVLYHSKDFTVYSDRVVQGAHEARALNGEHIISDYRSLPDAYFSSTISFKFSINGGDNEAVSGQDHHLTVKPEDGRFITPVITFGEKDPEHFADASADPYLPPNTEVTIRVDMSDVMEEFEEKGYYTAFNGERIDSSAFSGVYIAGGSEPLSWDFGSLAQNPNARMHDPDGDAVYEITLSFNPYHPEAEPDREWKLAHDISRFPSFESDQQLVDALYNLSLDETVLNTEEDGTFRTGAKWPGVWTRDISYSVLLSYAFLEPEISRRSLLRKVKRNRIIQDTGSGGAWPVSTDRVVWSLAAWEIYKVTGDREWLKQAYNIISNSLKDDLQTNLDKTTGLFKGETSFLDWREQSYPRWMDNADISQSIALGTNAVYYRTFEIMSRMADELGKKKESDYYKRYSETVKDSINEHLWNEEKGYYNQYLYGRHFLSASSRFEALGSALTILLGIADHERAGQIVSKAPAIPYGTPTIFPQIPDVPPYHNNGIWPFVQSYWNWAAAKAGNAEALSHGLGSLYRAAALFLTNKENFVAETGDYNNTQINSDRQLWSVAGNLAMIYRVFLGMEFKSDKIVFNPTVPEAYGGTKRVRNFRYRNAVLHFEVEGYGDKISKFYIDGEESASVQIPADLQGEHTVRIVLNNDSSGRKNLSLIDNRTSLSMPDVKLDGSLLEWPVVEGAASYKVYRNGRFTETVQQTEYAIPGQHFGYYQVSAVDSRGVESFLSEPVAFYNESDIQVIEVERFAANKVREPLSDYTGEGAVEITRGDQTELEIPFRADRAGNYLVSFRYSNGSGPWNTDNKCAIRTLTLNDQKAGTVVMPQRGVDEWSNWGMSNPITVQVEEGDHLLRLIWEPSNENMDGEVNRAMIDHVSLIRLNQP